jgi:hypothetical protein
MAILSNGFAFDKYHQDKKVGQSYHGCYAKPYSSNGCGEGLLCRLVYSAFFTLGTVTHVWHSTLKRRNNNERF